MSTQETDPRIMGCIVRGFTLWRPWPWVIAHAGKRIENRDWCAPRWMWRQLIAIHAGKRFDKDAHMRLVEGDYGVEAEACPPKEEHPDSVIVAVAQLQRCIPVEEVRFDDPQYIWANGAWFWVLGTPWVLPRPVAHRGAQGLWKLKPAALEEVRVQMEELANAATP